MKPLKPPFFGSRDVVQNLHPGKMGYPKATSFIIASGRPFHLQTFVAAMSIHGSETTTSVGGRSHVKKHTLPKTT